jgi:hypothetical protein
MLSRMSILIVANVPENGGNLAVEDHNISVVFQFEIPLMIQSGLRLASLNFDMAKLFRMNFPPKWQSGRVCLICNLYRHDSTITRARESGDHSFLMLWTISRVCFWGINFLFLKFRKRHRYLITTDTTDGGRISFRYDAAPHNFFSAICIAATVNF